MVTIDKPLFLKALLQKIRLASDREDPDQRLIVKNRQ